MVPGEAEETCWKVLQYLSMEFVSGPAVMPGGWLNTWCVSNLACWCSSVGQRTSLDRPLQSGSEELILSADQVIYICLPPTYTSKCVCSTKRLLDEHRIDHCIKTL